MTQKFYLRSTQTNPHPTSGEKSTTEPVAAQTYGLTPTDRDLLAAKGASATTQVTATAASSQAQNGCLGRWSTVPLKAGTYGAGTWTFAVQTIESNAAANAFFCQASIYFWRPSNSSVVGFVIDSDSSVGVEFGNNSTSRYGQVLSLTGSDVTIQDGDILVIEIWVKATQTNATSRNLTVCYNGTVDVTAAYSGTNPASYLSAPANIPSDASLRCGPAATALVIATSAKATLGVSKKITAKAATATSATTSLTVVYYTQGFNITRGVGGKLSTANNTKADLTVAGSVGQVALAAKIPISSSAKATRVNRTAKFVAKANAASSAQATSKSTRPISAKISTASSAKALLDTKRAEISAHISTAINAKATRLNRIEKIVAKSGTANSAKATKLTQAKKFTAKAATSFSQKATLQSTRPLNTKSNTASSAKATKLTQAKKFAAKAATSTSAKASLGTARKISAKILTSQSAKATTFNRLGKIAAKVSIASSLTSSLRSTRPLTAQVPTASNLKGRIETGRAEIAAHISIAINAKATTFQKSELLIAKASTSSSAKASLTTQHTGVATLEAKSATSTSAKASLNLARPISAKAATATFQKAGLSKSFQLTSKAAISAKVSPTQLRTTRKVAAKAAAATNLKGRFETQRAEIAAQIPISVSAEANLSVTSVSYVLFTVKIPTSTSSKVTVRTTRSFRGKSATSTYCRSHTDVRRGYRAKVPIAHKAKSTTLFHNRGMSVRLKTAISAKAFTVRHLPYETKIDIAADLKAALDAEQLGTIKVTVNDAGHMVSIYDHGHMATYRDIGHQISMRRTE